MNDDTRIFLKQAGVLLLCGVIGGFIGGMVAGCCNHHHNVFMKHMHFHHACPMKHKMKEQMRPQCEEKVTEENYIIIPKGLIEHFKGKMED